MERPMKLALGIGAAALTFKVVKDFSDQEHTFVPSPSITCRADRFKALDVKVGEPLRAPMGEYFLDKKGLYIHFRRWLPQANYQPLPPKGVVVIVHGLGEHCARYDHVAKAMNAAGLAVYALDHQGHGRSEGDRLHHEDFEDLVDDVLLLVALAKEENPLLASKTFLLGHSMGGLIATKTLARAQSEFCAAVISAPALSVDPKVITPATVQLLGVLSSVLPKAPADALNIDTLVKYMPIKDLYQNDPLVFHGKMPTRMANSLISNILVANKELAPKVELPYLLIHGLSDLVVPIGGSDEFHKVTKSKDKTYEKLNGGHELFNEVSGEAVTLVVNWLKARL